MLRRNIDDQIVDVLRNVLDVLDRLEDRIFDPFNLADQVVEIRDAVESYLNRRENTKGSS